MTDAALALAELQRRILAACQRCGRDPTEVQLVAVAKTQPVPRLKALYDAGQRVFGENYVQELERHRAGLTAASDVHWHLIGHLQSNKARRAAELAEMIHSVDSVRLVRALGAAARLRPAPLPVLVEVNLAGEHTKTGCAPSEAAAVLTEARATEGLSAVGLMCMPPPDQPSRPHFKELRQLRDRLREQLGLSLPHLSMGMSGDFEEAIEEGATLIRVGTALFGLRGARRE